MEDNQLRKQSNGTFVTFLLVLIMLLLSGLLVYLRYGDLILNRGYQFTDGKYGAETGVTSLLGRDGKPDETPEPPDAAPYSPDGGIAEGVDGGATAESVESGEPTPEEIPAAPKAEAVPAVMDYAAAKALPDGIALSTHDFTLRT